MALTNKGVNTDLVASTIGEPSGNVGVLCRSPKVNRWSKKKPHVDSREIKNGEKYWRYSDVSPDIRSGLYIPGNINGVWEYPRNTNTPNRLGDFRGYEHNGKPEMNLSLPKEFTRNSPYEVTYIFNGYNGDMNDNGIIGLQDIFDLENKYVCLGLEMTNTRGKRILKYSDRITHFASAPMFGASITLTPAEVDNITELAGTINIKVFMVEADEMIAGALQNPKRYSLRHLEEIEPTFDNRQFLAGGFSIFTNFDTVEPYKNATYISSTGYEQVVVSSEGKTGGKFDGYFFQAKILGGNQMGQNYVYPLPSYNLTANQSRTIYIPDFTLQMLQSGEARVEYSVWEGVPEMGTLITSFTHTLI